jgi:hypothetical protein
MNRIGDRRFLFAWQTIRAATQPDPEATNWRVAEVRWCRHRYSHAAPDHAVTVEVHRLDHENAQDRWSVMVVTEHWWDERHNPLRNHLWATHLSGSRESIANWFDDQARTFDRSHAAAG